MIAMNYCDRLLSESLVTRVEMLNWNCVHHSDQIRSSYEEFENTPKNTKTATSDGLGESECSTQVLSIWETWTRTRNGGTRIRSFAN